MVCYDRGADEFQLASGEPPSLGATFIHSDGNDAISLQADGVAENLFGELGVSGTGGGWELTDTTVKRGAWVTAPSAVFWLVDREIVDNAEAGPRCREPCPHLRAAPHAAERGDGPSEPSHHGMSQGGRQPAIARAHQPHTIGPMGLLEFHGPRSNVR